MSKTLTRDEALALVTAARDGALTIPEGVTSIGDAAFYGCTGLTSVTIPEGVTSIGDTAFCGCTGLTSVTIPEGVTRVGDAAFYGCTGLTSVTLAHHVALRCGPTHWQIGCKCASFEWWRGSEGVRFALENGYSRAELRDGLAAMEEAGKGAVK